MEKNMLSKLTKTLTAILLSSTISLLVGCATTKLDPYEEMSDAEIFKRVQKHFKQKKFIAATKDLEGLESHYPFGDYADKAQLANIYAYFKSDEPAAALAAADRFIQLHPRHKHVDYAYFMKGMINFNHSLGTFDRFLPLDRSQREMQSSSLAYDDFSLLLKRFPKTIYKANAHKRMIFLRNRLAAHEVHIARYYLSRKAYLAAANRCKVVIQRYDQSPSTPEALKLLAIAYENLGLHDLAHSTKEILDLNKTTN
jgi:outer membrane protein assembly factor BamD